MTIENCERGRCLFGCGLVVQKFRRLAVGMCITDVIVAGKRLVHISVSDTHLAEVHARRLAEKGFKESVE